MTTHLTKEDGAAFVASITQDRTGLLNLTCFLKAHDPANHLPRIEPVFLNVEYLVSERQCHEVAAIWAEMSGFLPSEILWEDHALG